MSRAEGPRRVSSWFRVAIGSWPLFRSDLVGGYGSGRPDSFRASPRPLLLGWCFEKITDEMTGLRSRMPRTVILAAVANAAALVTAGVIT